MELEIQPNTELDKLFLKLKTYPEADMPLTHIFTPGLYTRQIFMPGGSMVISRIHKFEHPFLVSKGRVTVWHSDGSHVMIQAPFLGVTKPGTQRVLYIHEDVIWTTFHVTDLTDPDAIVQLVTQAPGDGSVTISEQAMKQLQEGLL